MNYGSFLRTLSDLIEEKMDQELVIKPPLLSASSHDPVRKKAFISYSHKDTQHLERLRVHLKGHLHKKSEKDEEAVLKIICDDFWGNIWDDTKIPVGAIWQEEIEKALAQTKIAVCLVSADFFGSDFIREKELKVLYEAAQTNQIMVVSVIISDSVFEDSDLFKYQAINPPNQPLMKMTPYEQEAIWRKLAKHIFTNLSA